MSMRFRFWTGFHPSHKEASSQPATSLHRSLHMAFWTFGCVLVVVYAILAHFFSTWQEDRLLLRQIDLEFQSYLRDYPEVLTGSPPPTVASRFFSVYLGAASLPPDLRQSAAQLAPGFHGIDRSLFLGEDYILAIRDLEDLDHRLYMIYDVRRFDDYEAWYLEFLALALAGVVVFVIGLIWASRYSRSVLEPLTHLAETVTSESGPAQLAKALAERRDPTEVAVLGKSIEQSMRTIDQFVRREREFTRNASHELRTPLTVIRGAVELLRYESLSEAAMRRLQRVERSIQEMEELIETFLWLARARTGPTDGEVDVKPIVERVVESHRHLLGDRKVDVVLDIEPDWKLATREQILAVAIANLVKNAFYSTQEGSVTITGLEHTLTVSDTGPGRHSRQGSPDPDRPTRGFGLEIVRDLCKHNGWHLHLDEREPHGTVATIDLVTPRDAASNARLTGRVRLAPVVAR